MNKRIVLSSGALIGLFLIGSLMQTPGSRASGTVYSTPVTVLNATANPAITLDAVHIARAPYESTVTQVCQSGLNSCQFIFQGPSTGHRLVIENVSGIIIQGVGSTNVPSVMFGVASNAIGNSWGIPAGPNAPYSVGSSILSPFNQRVLAYVDVGGSATVTTYANNAFNSSATISGYIQDCSIEPCAALQH